MKSQAGTLTVIHTILLSFLITEIAAVGLFPKTYDIRLHPRLPVVCDKSSSSHPSLATAHSLLVSGGGIRNVKDDELLSCMEESDIMIEIRGGSINSTGQPLTRQQPLRISTYRKGTRQIRNAERRERRRQQRLRRAETRKIKLVAKSHNSIAKKLKNRNNLNIKRKVLHAGFGLFFATLNQIIPRERFVPGMTILTSLTLLMELLRYRKGFLWMNDILHFILGDTLRKQEMEGGKFTGSFYYFLGVTLTSYLFPTSCASLGICQLALADPSASYFGRQTRHVYWSRIENGFFGIGRNKGFLGFLGGAAVCFPFNYYVLNAAKFGGSAIIPGGQMHVALASISLGLAGAFADLCVPTPALTMPKKVMGIPMPRFHVDDNVVVPVFSGFACTKIFECLGWTNGVSLAKCILF
mmetsp:Transcript_9827/g.11448  ORF Transcript_9827/g.11448 Transcript_9827/m.11448 type:complete len:411 (-) Transcript_9827:119-1351(-)